MKIGGAISIVLGAFITFVCLMPSSAFFCDGVLIASGVAGIIVGVALIMLNKKITEGKAMKIWGTILVVYGPFGLGSAFSRTDYMAYIGVAIVGAACLITGAALLTLCYMKSTKTSSQQ